MPMKRALILFCLCLILPLRVSAQVVLDADAVFALSETPWRDRAAFHEALDAALGGVVIETGPMPDELRAADPWLWSLMGRFGAELDGVSTPGGIVACSRYGLATRDRLAATDLTDPEAFALYGATRASPDDASVWPENAVARLACMITWDDTRRVAILPEVAARDALARRFDRIARRDEADAETGGLVIYGPDGFRLEATDGRRDSVVQLESARIELRVSHQAIRFRSFLMNGGM